MKKIFSLCATLIAALAMNANEINIQPGHNALKTAITGASAGDVIILADGEYTEDGDFDLKNLTIQAAEGAHPVIKHTYYFKIENGESVTIKGIKFDGSTSTDHCLRSYTNSTGTEDVTLIDCEFTGYTKGYIVYTQRANRRWNSVTIRNCYFHNNKRSAIYITNESGDNQSCNALTIENSTFANFEEAYDVIYYNAPEAEHTTSLSIDHCTFYGHPKRAIYWQKSENIAVSNCIFSQSAENTYKSVECVGGTISNCLSYNTAGYSSEATSTDNITGDPQFADAANGDLTLAETSPAINAGTDGKTLGDSRWYPKTGTGISNNTVSAKAVKFIENGQLIIMKNGVKYDITGAIVK